MCLIIIGCGTSENLNVEDEFIATIPPGCGLLTTLELEGEATGLSGIVFLSPEGNQINLSYFSNLDLNETENNETVENLEDNNEEKSWRERRKENKNNKEKEPEKNEYGCSLPEDNIYLDGNDVWYNVTTTIGGFQFNVDGGAIVSSFSDGMVESEGFKIKSTGTSVFGYSFSNKTIIHEELKHTTIDHEHNHTFFPLKKSMEDLKYEINNLKARVEEYESTLHAPTLNAELLKLIKAPQVEHEIRMDDGGIIQGKLINETADEVFVQTRIGQLRIDKAHIVAIKDIEPLVPYVNIINESLIEKEGTNSLIVSGKVINEGGRREDFIRVIYKLYEGNTTNLALSDSVFISGNAIMYNNRVISDACLDPGQTGTFSHTIIFPNSLKDIYWVPEIKFDIYE